ncbi:entericidin A/B family lipoprotein [Sneathiella sp. CAU 1612]|uniref:Entericidin A/B family lipoprotein n=2 Tax=Sneathiella sedimenti TaxID=2816034 RepID=A0ABS3F9Y6_9PROT|nr:entericidin A/B family lipoprotein [Sneathiella sedimenti]
MMGLLVLASLSLAACETMEGAGEDIEDAGEAIQKEASD